MIKVVCGGFDIALLTP
nr:hypothetical protein [Vibrio parahaemolyticus]